MPWTDVFVLCEKASKREGDCRKNSFRARMKGLAGAGGREASKQSNPSWDSGGSIALLLSIIYLFCVWPAAVGHVPVWTATRTEHDCSNESQRTKPDNAGNKEHKRTGGMTFSSLGCRASPPAPWESIF